MVGHRRRRRKHVDRAVREILQEKRQQVSIESERRRRKTKKTLLCTRSKVLTILGMLDGICSLCHLLKTWLRDTTDPIPDLNQD